jgi:glutathione S-transferase
MIQLLEHPVSPYAQKVKLALYEKNIPFEARIPNLFGEDPPFDRANPRREVPALVDGETSVFDSTIILEYLEEKWPDPSLLPDAPADRARVRMIEDVCDTYVEAINWGMYEIRVFGRADGALAESMTARAAEQWRGVHGWLERQLGDREWFDGGRFGRGDLSAFPYVNMAATLGFTPPAGSALASWLGRASARESARRCVEAFEAAMPGIEQVPKLIASGAWVREYRDHRLEWMMRSGGESIVRDGVARKNICFTIEVR